MHLLFFPIVFALSPKLKLVQSLGDSFAVDVELWERQTPFYAIEVCIHFRKEYLLLPCWFSVCPFGLYFRPETCHISLDWWEFLPP